ncbi:protease TldD [Enhygromyxa salina]|uniref:Protease TldD n=1 Tax=Enhygromyxa salina TaxID=215803 RepID=A0A2S9XGC8_9BACT|nr:metallopeptidase TldD-related protein [Enhygromyxa salina]PRP91887.1 protease TldD [Enhygromyxa salina]
MYRLPTSVVPALALGLVLSLGAFACERGDRPGTRSPMGPPLSLETTTLEPERGEPAPALAILDRELAVNFAKLNSEAVDDPAYFMAYDLVGVESLWLEANDGALDKRHIDDDRTIDVDVRVGDPMLDNGHPTNGYYGGNGLGTGIQVSLSDDPLSLAQALWMVTELQYRDAVESWIQAMSDESMLTRADEPAHPDFTTVDEPLVHVEAAKSVDLEALAEQWSPVVARLSAILDADPVVQQASAMLNAVVENRSYVDTEGAKVQSGRVRVRLLMMVTAQAADGMALERFVSFERHDASQLPSPAELEALAEQLRGELMRLREAPIAEPYTGPAVLEGPAAGVFFHEIFGHRLEGHRQKDDHEGQTFTKMLGQQILPPFIDVYDDPTLASVDGTPLNGHYFVDDEAIPAARASLVREGVLEGFLLSRSVVAPFTASNGHGRRERGHRVVARQGNLIVSARETVPEGELRDRLIAEAKAQGKPYGVWFSDIQGGYTITDRSGPQAFKVLPLMVYRVWTDGRPDELVRGVDVVGTPLAAFETIVAAGDEPGIFNGMCGAESGWVPVSAVSPSLLLSKLEIEKAMHERDKPPLLSPPPRERGGQSSGEGTVAR